MAPVEGCRLTASDILWSCLPCFHMSTQFLTIYPTLLAGATVVLAERFLPDTFWDDTRKYGVTQAQWIGAMFVRLMSQPEKPDDADNPVRIIWGAPVPEGMREKIEERFGLKIIDLYGQTEDNVVSYMPYDGPRQGGCGKPRDFMKLRYLTNLTMSCQRVKRVRSWFDAMSPL